MFHQPVHLSGRTNTCYQRADPIQSLIKIRPILIPEDIFCISQRIMDYISKVSAFFIPRVSLQGIRQEFDDPFILLHILFQPQFLRCQTQNLRYPQIISRGYHVMHVEADNRPIHRNYRNNPMYEADRNLPFG